MQPPAIGGLDELQQRGVFQPLQRPPGLARFVAPHGGGGRQAETGGSEDRQAGETPPVGRVQRFEAQIKIGPQALACFRPGVQLLQPADQQAVEFGQRRPAVRQAASQPAPQAGGGQRKRQRVVSAGARQLLRRLRLGSQGRGDLGHALQQFERLGRVHHVQRETPGDPRQVVLAGGEQRGAGRAGRQAVAQAAPECRPHIVQHHQTGRNPQGGREQGVAVGGVGPRRQADAQRPGHLFLHLAQRALADRDPQRGGELARQAQGQLGLAHAAHAADADDGGALPGLQRRPHLGGDALALDILACGRGRQRGAGAANARQVKRIQGRLQIGQLFGVVAQVLQQQVELAIAAHILPKAAMHFGKVQQAQPGQGDIAQAVQPGGGGFQVEDRRFGQGAPQEVLRRST